jgi:serine/threonine protein phosphatase 1
MKLFVTSDVHSFYEPLQKALDRAGFDANNKEHWLIVCGDCFDRGPDSVRLLHYIMSLERKILVKGNHDLLLEECCTRGFPYGHDKANGTFRTVQDLGGSTDPRDFEECCQTTWNKTAAYRDLLVNYFETENYIFVHSWLPTVTYYDRSASKPWHQAGKTYFYLEDWRKANNSEWEEAMWGNPFRHAQDGLNKTGKTIVFGHWHCSTGYALNDKENKYSEFEENACWEPYINKEQGIIGIDRCTAHTGEVNVLVLEDDFLDNID